LRVETRGLQPASLVTASWTLSFLACRRGYEFPVPQRTSLKPSEVGEIKIGYRPVAVRSRMASNSQTEEFTSLRSTFPDYDAE
jgi:hypothetical protein